MVEVGNVETFDGARPDKAQAVKVLEEAAEVFAAWQRYDAATDLKGACRLLMEGECADLIQATCNLLAASGVDSLSGALEVCKVMNIARGRKYSA